MATQRLVLGNTARPFDAKRHSWTFYVCGATEHVKEVRVYLHPTFRDPVRRLTGPPFELKSRGWGTFDLDVTIFWKAGGNLKTTWELQFDLPDASSELDIPAEVLASAADAAPPVSLCGMPGRLPSQSSRPHGSGGGGGAASDWPTDVSGGSDDGSEPGADAMVEAPSGPATARGVAEAAEVPAQPLGIPGAAVCGVEELRRAQAARLAGVAFLRHTDPNFMHGRGYEGPAHTPCCTWRSQKPPRDDHDAPPWLTASEFVDEPSVLQAKCRHLAQLMRASHKTVAYTGAGISASVIGQAARSGEQKVGWKPDTRKAKPTLTHHTLGLLGQQNLIHSWVQQNHDGLPQKAGFPQERINEIHGSWYDPSNPVVKYSGSLHDRAFPWMERDAADADLVLVLGTSLGGLNADQVATRAAERSLQGCALGTVCINLQQTDQDGKMTLRLFGRSDDVLAELLLELGFGRPDFGLPAWPAESRALVPYGADGRRTQRGRMWLDLREGQLVRITEGHNIQGARQPQYMHIGARKTTTYKGLTRPPAVGRGRVVKREDDTSSFRLDIEGAQMRLGIWWLDVASRGVVEVLPVVNQNPVFEG